MSHGAEGPGTAAHPAAGAADGARPALTRRTTVLAGTAVSGLLAASTRALWVTASAPDLTGMTQQVEVRGADAAPTVLAMAIVAVAASLATSLSSAWVRFLTGPVLVLSGLGAGAAVLGVLRDPQAAASSAVAAATSVVNSGIEAETTSWPLLALLPAAAVLGVGVTVLLVGGTWPRRDRYRSPALAVAADPAEDPAAAWDALTRGEDPSLEESGPASRTDGTEPRR